MKTIENLNLLILHYKLLGNQQAVKYYRERLSNAIFATKNNKKDDK